jgi:hypothetical protein
MLREILILLSCGSVGYAWLCAVTAPLVRAVRSLAASKGERAQRVIHANGSRRRSGARESLWGTLRGETPRLHKDAWLALALALGAGLLWTAIIAAAILLAMMLEPRAGLALLGSHLFWPGVGGGAIVWCGQLLTTFRVPRFGDDVEAAAALAIVALVDDRPDTLRRLHQLYALHAIQPPRVTFGGSRPATVA